MKISRKTGISLAILLAGLLSFLAAERLLYGPRAILGAGGTRGGAAFQGEGLPPYQAFVALGLGGFRGLLADVLWMRAARLQDQGRFLEMVQLAHWITQLEPQFTETWVYHAWNMAYNISVLFADPSDRWRWVQNGLRLLRDEGLRWNAGDPRMYWEVGWIYQHKIGGPSDSAAPYYRRELARGMEAILPGGRYRADRLAVTATVRERLIAEYRLDPRILDIVRRRFGDLDWRIPETHALYWAVCGLAAAGEKGSLPCERMIYSSMIELFRRGTLVVSPDGETQLRLPDLDLALSAVRSLESAMAPPGRDYLSALHESFLGDAILLSFVFGRHEQADALWQLRRSRHPNLASASTPDEFVRRYATLRMQSVAPDEALAMVFETWAQSYRATGAGWDEAAAGYRRWAELLWTGWLSAQRKETRPADPAGALRQIQREALKQVRREVSPAWQTRLEGVGDHPQGRLE
jgi:hypothetical protein